MCFPQIDASLRIDEDFVQKRDDIYHKLNSTTSLLNIPHFKPVTNACHLLGNNAKIIKSLALWGTALSDINLLTKFLHVW